MRKLRLSCLLLLLVFIASNFLVASENTDKGTTKKQVTLVSNLSMSGTQKPLLGTFGSREYGASWYENHNNCDWITNVTFNTINNNTVWEGPPHYYGDYTDIATCVAVDQIYTLSVTFFCRGNFAEHVRAWIDWNQNEEFEASESYYLGSGINVTLTGDIAVPNDALTGETRMRVIEQFGSDPGGAGSCNGQGNHIDTYGETEDYTIFVSNSANVGYVTGLVTDSSLNPIDNALIEIGGSSVTVGPDGVYLLPLNPLTYCGTASAQYHNSVTIDNITVFEDETTAVNFMLPTPQIDVDTSPIILDVNPGEIVNLQRNVTNVGDGVLEFDIDFNLCQNIQYSNHNIEINNLGHNVVRNNEELNSTNDEYSPSSQFFDEIGIRNIGDEVFCFGPSDLTGDTQCVGVEFDGEFFWVTGSFMPGNHHLYKFDINGNLVATFIQPNFGTWGWRDLAWDGEYLYGSYSSEVDIIDPADGLVISSFNGPEDPNRALAYDPVTGHFWTANFDSSIYEFDQNGTINTYPNTQSLNIYGMAWDNASEGGPFLWLFSQDGPSDLLISQFDPIAGELTGVMFNGIDNGNDQTAGGCTFTTEFPTNPQTSVLFCLQQWAFTDIVKGYEIAPFSWWLTINPMNQVLQPTENVNLDITIDFTGEDIVPGSTYETTIFVETNTPNTLEIPVIVQAATGIEGDTAVTLCKKVSTSNYPNPFNPSTTIAFSLPEESSVAISVFNVKGQQIKELLNKDLSSGDHTITWDGNDANNKPVSSGVYFYKVVTNNETIRKKMLLMK